jgi:hypothetical protein
VRTFKSAWEETILAKSLFRIFSKIYQGIVCHPATKNSSAPAADLISGMNPADKIHAVSRFGGYVF